MTKAATVTGIAVSASSATLGVGGAATLHLTLSQAMTVSGGTPTLLLNDGGTATYVGGSGTNQLSFSYTTAAGQNTAHLAVIGMALNGATISNGPSGFGTPVAIPTGAQPNALTVADLNHDGRPDIAVATAGGVAILLADGHGGFGPASIISGPAAAGIAAADFNGDGNTDLVVTTASGVTIMLGNGSGTVQTSASYAAGSNPGAVAVGNILPDGIPDMVVGGSSSVAAILLSNPAGYATMQVFLAAGQPTSGVALADLNGDGRPDIIAAVTGYAGGVTAGGVAVILNTGIPNYHAVIYSAGPNPVAVAVADVNGDGKPDLVVADKGGAVTVLLGDGTGAYGFATTYAAGAQPSSVAVADVNGDGIPDIIVTDSLGGIDVLRGNGSGGFGAPIVYAAGLATASVTVADINGDGIPDIVATTATGVVVLPGIAQTGVTLDTASAATAPGADTGLVVNTRTRIISISASHVALSLAVGQTVVFSVLTSDVVLVAGGTPALLLNNGGSAAYTGGSGTQTLTFSYTAQPGQSTTDLKVTGLSTGNAILSAPGDNAFLPPITYALAQNPYALTLADLNGDGKTDIIATDASGGIDVLLGNGTGAFSAPVTYRWSAPPAVDRFKLLF